MREKKILRHAAIREEAGEALVHAQVIAAHFAGIALAAVPVAHSAYPVPRFKAFDALADGRHRAGELMTYGDGDFIRGYKAGAVGIFLKVRAADAGQGNLNFKLAGAGGRLRGVNVTQVFTAVPAQSFHQT